MQVIFLNIFAKEKYWFQILQATMFHLLVAAELGKQLYLQYTESSNYRLIVHIYISITVNSATASLLITWAHDSSIIR